MLYCCFLLLLLVQKIAKAFGMFVGSMLFMSTCGGMMVVQGAFRRLTAMDISGAGFLCCFLPLFLLAVDLFLLQFETIEVHLDSRLQRQVSACSCEIWVASFLIFFMGRTTEGAFKIIANSEINQAHEPQFFLKPFEFWSVEWYSLLGSLKFMQCSVRREI